MGNENNIFEDFDFINFEKSWAELDQNQQSIMLESVAELSPTLAVQPIIAGISSYHYLLRNKARAALNIIQLKMTKALDNKGKKELYLKAIQESDCFCSKIFLQVKTGISLPELSFYFQTLMKSNGKGPFYAWKICASGIISLQTFKTLIPSLSDREKLILTDQYLQSSSQVRIEWAFEFKKLLRKINRKTEIVNFLSDIFDQNKDVDPFLFNIPLLKNVNQSLLDDLYSSDSVKKEKTLKAVSLIKDSLDINLLKNCLEHKTNKNIKIVAFKIIEFSSVDTYSQPLLTDCLLNILKNNNQEDAFYAFKALVITRSIPFHKLFIKVIK
ncbi:MAG: hypothetical protein KAR45_06050, partial [Desulfobacteraceae bacterium]|nr:hypothetical protein [Desulfobacteraceae bacterium]